VWLIGFVKFPGQMQSRCKELGEEPCNWWERGHVLEAAAVAPKPLVQRLHGYCEKQRG